MLRNLFAGLAGGLFGLGLVVSGMTDTVKVQGWLDVFGAWDPTLAFVLGFGGWQGVVFLLAMIAGMVAAPPIRGRIFRPAAA